MDLNTKRHSLSHIMAQAVKNIYWDAVKVAIWPATEDWFYYDFDFWGIELSDNDLKKIEKAMKKIISQNQDFKRFEVDFLEARGILDKMWEWFKKELVDKIEKKDFKNEEKLSDKISFYVNISKWWDSTSLQDFIKESWFYDFSDLDWDQVKNLKFIDMCTGPHVENTREIDTNSFKLAKVSWAYRLWDEKNKMLTRIQAYAFDNKEDLDKYLNMLEEAKKRDHRVLGQKLELFTFDDEVWPGLPLWLPAWSVLVEEIEKLAKEKEEEFGYDRVRSPHIAKDKLYLRSGHLPYYEEDMFPPMMMDNERYFLKAMNCPHHHKIYAAVPKSYKDLPVRYAEYGHCYRYEDSWSLFWLMRVRSLCMNDAHIYCSEEQFEDEFIKVIEMYKFYFDLFWIDKFQMRLSKHSKEWLWKKYVDNEKLWIKTEKQVRDALDKTWVPYVESEDEAAFYGPKIDVQIWSAIGREFTLATNQLDFAVPERFDLVFKDKDWKDKTPICIHRAPLSTHERLIWFLIEHFAWIFPLRLSPKQVKIIPVSDKFDDYANKVNEELKKYWFRTSVDLSSDWLNKKVRNAEKMHINYILVVWEKEETDLSVSVRNYKTKEQSVEKLDDFISRIKEERDSRGL